MNIEIFRTDDEVARAAAALVAQSARDAIAARGTFRFAVSGGKTPWVMLGELGKESLPWDKIQIFQIDERIAPAGDPDRNLTHLRGCLPAAMPASNLFAMPVNDADLAAAAKAYAAHFASEPLDLAHLGMGPDGHTASLIPGDPVLNVTDADIALTGVYQNRRRMTMTYPLLNRSRAVLWLVTGASKAPVLPKLLAADPSIPAGRIAQTNATLFLDTAARS